MDLSSRTLISAIGLFTVVFALYLLVLSHFEKSQSYTLTSIFIRNRAEQIINELPSLVKNKPHGLFFGASEIEGFFDNRLVDADLQQNYGKQIASYNLALRSAPIPFMKAFVTRLAEEYEAKGLKSEYIIYKIPYGRMTIAAENAIGEESYAAAAADLYSMNMIQKLIKRSPAQGLDMAVKKYLFRGLSRNTFMHPARTFFDDKGDFNKSVINDFFSIWRLQVFKESKYWNASNQGLYAWNMPASRATLEHEIRIKKTKTVKNWGYKYFQRCCDVLDLNWSSDYVQQTLETLDQLHRISDKVILLHIQEEPGFANQRNQSQNDRMTSLLQTYSQGGKNKLIDLRQRVELQDSDYVDFNHVNEVGFRKIIPILSSEIAKTLDK